LSDPPARVYEFGPFRVDGVRRLLLREGNPVRLTAKAFDILLLLLEEKGRLVEKDELMRRVWPDAVVEENNLTVNISALRKALGESPGDRRFLATVPGRGYQFVAEVRQRSDGAPVDRGVADAGAVSEAGGRWPLVLAALFAATIAVGYYASSRSSRGSGNVGVGSVAVLPFTNVSDVSDEYLSDGISESLINSLSQLPGVKVIARSSAFTYKGTELDLKEVAKALGVEAIVTGRVGQRGGNLSISVELVNASDKTQIWGKQYDRRASDFPAVLAEISREIAEKLRRRLSADERRQLARSAAVNPRAYELLLRGRFNFNKGTDEARKKAVDYFDQAIAIEPTYAPAYAELANAYSILGHDLVIDQKEAAHRADAAAVKALELDEGLADAHKALAYNKQLAWDWAGAEREYERAIELNPNYAEARAPYSTFLSLMGRHEQASAEARRAKELDPLSIRINMWVFGVFFFGRRYDQALDIVEQMRELDPNHPFLPIYFAYTQAAMGRYPEAIAAYKETIERGDNSASVRIYLGYAYAKAGQPAEARAILSELRRAKERVSAAELAILYAGLGESDQAFQSLERAYSAHDLQLQYLGVDPLLDSLRPDPRFQALMRRVGLPVIEGAASSRPRRPPPGES
jgi:DNA-binding winged helix-turn-helix (wHTH) protein/TolB-like protein/Tfp pilus assembly protein PilF